MGDKLWTTTYAAMKVLQNVPNCYIWKIKRIPVCTCKPISWVKENTKSDANSTLLGLKG